jgi:PAS domain S-box-containing protein
LTDILLKIIEEFADGFLIINEENRILFFNDVLLKNTGLRSSDILESEAEFLESLCLDDGNQGEHEESITTPEGGTRKVRVQSLPVQSDRGTYHLVRVQAVVEPLVSAEESSHQWEMLFNNLADPVLDVDLSGTIRAANPSFFKLVGYSPEDRLPNIVDLYAHSAELEDRILRLSQSDSIQNLETQLKTKTNDTLRVLDTTWAIRDERGILRSYTSHFKDITYLRNLEARLKISERNYLLLFDTILSSIIIVDPSGLILNCNNFAERLYGYARIELVGRDFSEVFRVPNTGRPIKEIIREVKTNLGRYLETDIPRRCSDGTIKFTYASYAAITSTLGETIAYSIMEKDLTERVRLEKKLQSSFQRIKSTQSAAILGTASAL